MTRYEYSVGEDDPRYALEAELGETLAGLVGLEPLDHRELSAFLSRLADALAAPNLDGQLTPWEEVAAAVRVARRGFGRK